MTRTYRPAPPVVGDQAVTGPSLRALSTSELTIRLTEQVSRLARQEAGAAVAELRAKSKRAGLGAGLFGAAGYLAVLGGGAITACLVLLLAMALPVWLAALIIGVAILVIAGVLALIGRMEFRRVGPPIPDRTVARVTEDAQAIRKEVTR